MHVSNTISRVHIYSYVIYLILQPTESCSSSLTSSQETLEQTDYSLYMPTPAPKLPQLKEFVRSASDGRISPIRGQLLLPLSEAADSTQRYYRRKASEAIDLVLDTIAPGQSKEQTTGIGERHILLL